MVCVRRAARRADLSGEPGAELRERVVHEGEEVTVGVLHAVELCRDHYSDDCSGGGVHREVVCGAPGLLGDQIDDLLHALRELAERGGAKLGDGEG